MRIGFKVLGVDEMSQSEVKLLTKLSISTPCPTKTVVFMGQEYRNWPAKVVLLAFPSSKEALIPPPVAWQLTYWISYALPFSLWVDHENSLRFNAFVFDLMTQHLFQSLSIDSCCIACRCLAVWDSWPESEAGKLCWHRTSPLATSVGQVDSVGVPWLH